MLTCQTSVTRNFLSRIIWLVWWLSATLEVYPNRMRKTVSNLSSRSRNNFPKNTIFLGVYLQTPPAWPKIGGHVRGADFARQSMEENKSEASKYKKKILVSPAPIDTKQARQVRSATGLAILVPIVCSRPRKRKRRGVPKIDVHTGKKRILLESLESIVPVPLLAFAAFFSVCTVAAVFPPILQNNAAPMRSIKATNRRMCSVEDKIFWLAAQDCLTCRSILASPMSALSRPRGLIWSCSPETLA